MNQFKYQTKRLKFQKKAEKAFFAGNSLVMNFWNKKIHKLDYKFFNSRK